MNVVERRMTAPAALDLPKQFGQGKRATTILGSEGEIVTVINDVPYKARERNPVFVHYRGARPMHASTLRIPCQNYTNYETMSQKHFSGRKDLKPVERRMQTATQQMSKIRFGNDDSNHWETKYRWDFHQKPSAPPAVIHYPAFNNKLNMNEGGGMKQTMKTSDKQGSGTSFTQYNRIHNRLGAALGPGVTRPYPVRHQYDVLTGEDKGECWSPHNAKISGNRVLYQSRREQTEYNILS